MNDDTINIQIYIYRRKKPVSCHRTLTCVVSPVDKVYFLNELENLFLIQSTKYDEIFHLYKHGRRENKYSYCRKCRTWFNASGSNIITHFTRNHNKPATVPMPIGCEDEYRKFKLFFIFCVHHHIPLNAYNDTFFTKRIFPYWPRISTFLNLIDTSAQFINEKILEEISATSHVGIITDGWSDLAKRRFLGITFFYIKPLSAIHSGITTRFAKLAKVKQLKHTSEAIVDCIKETINLFDCSLEKIDLMVSDSASTMIKTARLLNINWVPCFLHLFNLCFLRMWEMSPSIAKECVHLANALQKRGTFVDFIEEKMEEDSDIKKRNIITFSKTRWMSLANCIRSIVELSPEITEYFIRYPQLDMRSDEDSDDFFQTLDFSEQEEALLYSPISSEHLNSLIDISNLMKNLNSSFESMQRCLINDPGKFYTHLEATIIIVNTFLSTYPDSIWVEGVTTFKTSLENRFYDTNNADIRPIMLLHLFDLSVRVSKLFNERLIEVIKLEAITILSELDESAVEDTRESVSENEPDEYEQILLSTQDITNPPSEADPPQRYRKEIDDFLKHKHDMLRRKSQTDKMLPCDWSTEDEVYPNIYRIMERLHLYIGASLEIENTFSIARRILRWDRMKTSRDTIENLMLLTMNQDLLVEYLVPDLKEEFCRQFKKENFEPDDEKANTVNALEAFIEKYQKR